MTAHFAFWYGTLRFFVDCFREYDSYWLGIGRGQYFNLLMAACGVVLMAWVSRRKEPAAAAVPGEGAILRHADDVQGGGGGFRWGTVALWLKAVIFYGLAILSCGIPSGWTQAVFGALRGRSLS